LIFVLEGVDGQAAAREVEVLEVEGAGEELLERRRNFFALFRGKPVFGNIQVRQVSRATSQKGSEQLRNYQNFSQENIRNWRFMENRPQNCISLQFK